MSFVCVHVHCVCVALCVCMHVCVCMCVCACVCFVCVCVYIVCGGEVQGWGTIPLECCDRADDVENNRPAGPQCLTTRKEHLESEV